MSLIIIFNMVSTPIAKAITGAEEAIFFVMATLCSSIGISIALENPNTGKILMDCFNTLSENARKNIEFKASLVSFGVKTVVSWEIESFKSITDEVRSWFSDNYEVKHEFGKVLVSNDDNLIGFTKDTKFQIYFPGNASSAVFNFPSAVMFIHNKSYLSTFEPYNISPFMRESDNCPAQVVHMKSAEGLSYYRWQNNINNNYNASGKIYDCVLGTNPYYERYQLVASNTVPFCPYDTFYHEGQSSAFYYDLSGNSYFIDLKDGKFVFQNVLDSTRIYKDMTFNSQLELVDWFCNECGLATRTYSIDTLKPYDPAIDSDNDGVVYDPDAVARAKKRIDSIDTPTVDTVIPGTKTQAKAIADGLEDVFDTDITTAYTGGVKLPTTNGSLWYEKFPFCIPFDIINLFSAFYSSDSSAPNFHFCVIPENSFGLHNNAVYWDIDFREYSILVKLLRFFLAVFFSVWLISVTRNNMIKG